MIIVVVLLALSCRSERWDVPDDAYRLFSGALKKGDANTAWDSLSPATQRLAARALTGVEAVLDSWDKKGSPRASRVQEDATSLALGGKYWYVDSSKARCELGFTARSPETTLKDAVAWIHSRGPLPEADGVMKRVMRGVYSRRR